MNSFADGEPPRQAGPSEQVGISGVPEWELVMGHESSMRVRCTDTRIEGYAYLIEHSHSAHSGYCVDCGHDGWTAEDRRRIEATKGRVRRT